MLLNCDPTKDFYVIGSTAVAYELAHHISHEVTGNIQLIDVDAAVSLPANSQCIIGFLNIEYRRNLLNKVNNLPLIWPTFVHSKAHVTSPEFLTPGTVVLPLAFLGHKVKLGNFAFVSQTTSIGHACEFGTNTVISPGTTMGGSTVVGNNVAFGQACSIKDKLIIGSDINFFMNSVVTKNITDPGSYYCNKKVTVNEN